MKPTRKILKVQGGDRLIMQGVTIDVERVKTKRARLVITADRSIGYVYLPAKVVDTKQIRS